MKYTDEQIDLMVKTWSPAGYATVSMALALDLLSEIQRLRVLLRSVPHKPVAPDREGWTAPCDVDCFACRIDKELGS